MFRYYYFAYKATLSDYLTLAEFLASKDVDKGFVVYDRRTGSACLGFLLHEDCTLDPQRLLPQYMCISGDNGIDNDELDQAFRLDDAMFMSMLSCDIVQTKNLATERRAIAARMGVQLDDDKIRVVEGEGFGFVKSGLKKKK
jgi:hypothetical protein